MHGTWLNIVMIIIFLFVAQGSLAGAWGSELLGGTGLGRDTKEVFSKYSAVLHNQNAVFTNKNVLVDTVSVNFLPLGSTCCLLCARQMI